MQTRESAQPGDGRDGTTAVARAAVVVGAGGGIGRALVEAIAETGDHVVVHALSRGLGTQAAGVRWGLIDVTNEDMIRTAAAGIGAPLDLVIVATGMLHQQGYGPERA